MKEEFVLEDFLEKIIGEEITIKNKNCSITGRVFTENHLDYEIIRRLDENCIGSTLLRDEYFVLKLRDEYVTDGILVTMFVHGGKSKFSVSDKIDYGYPKRNEFLGQYEE